MTPRRISAAVVFALVLSVAIAPGAATKEILGERCQNTPAQFDSVASHTVSQSFTPKTATISSWEAGIWVITGRKQTLHSRLVFHPTGDAGNVSGAAGPGVVIAEASATVSGRKFSLHWVRFKLEKAVATIPHVEVPGGYAIEIDFVLDNTIPSGAHESWYACGDAYPEGRAYLGLNGKLVARDAPSQPSVRQNFSRSNDLLFRVYAG